MLGLPRSSLTNRAHTEAAAEASQKIAAARPRTKVTFAGSILRTSIDEIIDEQPLATQRAGIAPGPLEYIDPKLSACRTGTTGGLCSCRTFCARPRGGRGSGSRPS